MIKKVCRVTYFFLLCQTKMLMVASQSVIQYLLQIKLVLERSKVVLEEMKTIKQMDNYLAKLAVGNACMVEMQNL